jgi:GDP-L-fucose synthase
LLEHYSDALHINVGTGTDITIQELAELIAETVGFEGKFVFDKSKPDGAPRKCTDITRIRQLGWTPRIDLKSGLRQTYNWFLSQQKHFERHVYS